MANQHDTEKIPIQQHLCATKGMSTDGQLALLEAYLKCQMDLNAYSASHENFIQLNATHFSALMAAILTQIEQARATFAQEYPNAVLYAELPTHPPLRISPNRLNGLLEGLVEQVQHIRQTAGVPSFEAHGERVKQ